MPFESEAQRKYLWSQKPEVAKEFAKKTPKGKTLPKRAHKIENKDYYKAMVEIRRSSAASPQDNRPNRERSRQDQLRSAVQRSRNEE